ncbi:MAG: sulfatase-like hydrolase/transferase [Verrucomicrobiota bacterium]
MKTLIALVLIAFSFASTHAEEARKPNIVFFFIDDWAWYGSTVAMDGSMKNSRMPILEMPNLERLAAEGMKFRNAYASPQCSPSRVCVQTGQSSPRNGFTVYLNRLGQDYYNEKKSKGLPVISCISDETIDPETVTIPEALAPLGYASAHFGKWHMRGDPGEEGYLAHDGDTDNKPGNTLVTGLAEGESKPKRLPDDMTDPKLMFSITERAIGFIEKSVSKKQPFYVQISHYAMHSGSECLPETREKYAKHPAIQDYYQRNGKDAATVRIGDDPAVWFGMAEDLDGRIGAVIEKLAELGIVENTYVVVMSDNGYRHKELHVEEGMIQPMHAHKWWAWQGGVRVTMIVKGPRIAAGSSFEANVINYDLLPTFVDWAGGDPKDLDDIDGVSLARYLEGRKPKKKFSSRYLYFHYPHNRTSMPHSAIVSGTSKVMHFYQYPDLPILFDLKNDEGEVVNIATERVEEHHTLLAELNRYLDEVGARIPKLNPAFDAEAEKAYRNNRDYVGKVAPYEPFAERRELQEDEKFGAVAP